MAGTFVGWRNWAGNETAEPREVIAPRSADEVAAAVGRAAELGLTVRMTGAGHSFTPAAVTDGIMLRPGRMTGIRSVDAAAGLVTAAAGCPLRVLNDELLRRGLALANMGDIQVQTVAGAIQTGTHGTGRDVGGMAAQVAGLEMVLADGTVTSCSATANPELFAAARVGLGALGVLTAVTFKVVPAFLLAAREEPMRWPDVIGRLGDLIRDNEHFEFFWFPHTEGCLTKRNNRTAGPARPLSTFRYRLDAESLAAVLREIRALIDRRDWRISFPIEVRVAPGDDAWLSTAYGRDTAYIAFHVFHASPHAEYFRDMEAVLTAAGGRPHWGKMHTRDAAYLRAVYPRFDDFAELRDKLDPGRRFANHYLTQVLGR